MCTSKYPCWSLKYPCLKLQTCFGCCKTMYGETTSHSEVYLTLSARNTAGLCKSWDGESPALVDVLKRKINGKKHSNSYFSLEAPLLCWSVSIKTEERSFQRSLAQTENSHYPRWETVTLALLLVTVWFHKVECPQLRHGQCVLACPPQAKVKEKKEWENKSSSGLMWELLWTLKMDNLCFWEEGRGGKGRWGVEQHLCYRDLQHQALNQLIKIFICAMPTVMEERACPAPTCRWGFSGLELKHLASAWSWRLPAGSCCSAWGCLSGYLIACCSAPNKWDLHK